MRVPLSLSVLSFVVLAGGYAPAACALEPIEVRQPEAGGEYRATALGRAYAPCLAPNTTTHTGEPACMPAVTSACGTPTLPIELAIGGRQEFQPKLTILYSTRFANLTPECANGDYTVEIRTRPTVVGLLVGDQGCAGESCTFPDRVSRVTFPPVTAPQEIVLSLLGEDAIDPSYEILGITIVAPDGLPLLSVTDFTSNVVVPYAACTTPGPIYGGCPAVPWQPACDYETGAMTWEYPLGFAVARTTLRDMAGPPLCASGAWSFEATVRSTQLACGPVGAPQLCTLPDRTVTRPVPPPGRKFDAEVALGGAASGEIVSARLIDPTGVAVAAPGVIGVRPLVKPRIDLKGTQLRVKAVIPIDPKPVAEFPDYAIDPTLEDGFTLRLRTRDGVAYVVTIPSERWQLRAPLGSGFDYEDEGGVLGGVRRIRLKRVKKAVGADYGYAVDVVADGVDLSAGDQTGLTLSLEVARAFPAGPQRVQTHRTCSVKGSKVRCK